MAAHLAPELRGARVVDPACGDGRWLVAVARHAPDARLVGIDADPLAIDAARRTLAAAGVHAELRCADALAEGAVPRADWVVGNPPFVRPQHLDRDAAADWWSRYALATDKVDLSACFVELALRVADRAALVLPANLLSLASWAAVRARLLAAGVDLVLDVPADAFGATIRSIVVVAGGSDRRRAGQVDRSGLVADRALGVSAAAWSTEGALPELPGVPLGELVSFHMGVVCGDYPRYVHTGRRHADDRPTCRGRDVGRWTIARRDEYVRYLPEEMLARKPYVAPKHAGLFDVPQKLVVAGTSGREIRAALDEERLFPLDSCYVAHARRADVDLLGVLGLLCSRAVGEWYGARFGAARVKGVELARIPVPPPPWPRVVAAAAARDDDAVDAAVAEAYAGIPDGR